VETEDAINMNITEEKSEIEEVDLSSLTLAERRELAAKKLEKEKQDRLNSVRIEVQNTSSDYQGDLHDHLDKQSPVSLSSTSNDSGDIKKAKVIIIIIIIIINIITQYNHHN
jgi:hypothetical protein